MSSGERAGKGEEETGSGGMTWLPERRGDGGKEEVLERLGGRHGSSCYLRGCTRQGLWIHRSAWGTRLPAREGMGCKGGRAREQQRMEEEAMWHWLVGSIQSGRIPRWMRECGGGGHGMDGTDPSVLRFGLKLD